MIDINEAKLNPAKVFASPKQLLEEKSLTKAQKVEILHHWAYDLNEMAVAEEENMPNPDNNQTTELLEQIHDALHQLGEKYKEDQGGVTKHGLG